METKKSECFLKKKCSSADEIWEHVRFPNGLQAAASKILDHSELFLYNLDSAGYFGCVVRFCVCVLFLSVFSLCVLQFGNLVTYY